MKTRIIILAAALVCMTAACSVEAERFHGTDQKSEEPMSATELKNRIVDEINGTVAQVTLAGETDLIEVATHFAMNYSSYGISDSYFEKMQDMWTYEDYPETNPEVEIATDLLDGMASMLKAPEASINATYKHLRKFAASFKNVSGILTANKDSLKFIYTPASDRLEFRFKNFDNIDCALAIKVSSKTTRIHAESLYTSETHYYAGKQLDSTNLYISGSIADIDVPTSINVSLKVGKNELASLVIKSGVAIELNSNSEYEQNCIDEGDTWEALMDTTIVSVDFNKLSVNAVLKTEDYKVTAEALVRGGKAEESVGLYKGNKELLSEYVTLPYVLNVQAAVDSLQQYLNYMPTPYAAMYAAAEIVDNIEGTVALGDVYLTGKFDLNLYTDTEVYDNIHYGEEYAEYMNKVMDVKLYYGEDKWQAKLTWLYYQGSMMTLLEFADGTYYRFYDIISSRDLDRVMYNVQGLYLDLMDRVQRAVEKFTPAEEPEVEPEAPKAVIAE